MKKFLAVIMITLLAACGGSKDKPAPEHVVPAPGGVIETKVPPKYEHIFTSEEIAFIKQGRIIKAGGNFNYPPFIFFDDKGELVGVSRDYLDAIAKISGLRFSIQMIAPHQAVFLALEEKQIDLVLSIRPAPGRNYLAPTQPYINTRGVFVSKKDVRAADIKKMGVIRGSAQATYLSQSHKSIEAIDSTNDETCLKLLLQTESPIDACMMNVEAYAFLGKRLGIAEQIIAHPIPFDFILGFGYHKEETLLGAIIIKSLNAMPIKDRDEIEERWLTEPHRTKLCPLGLWNCNVE